MVEVLLLCGSIKPAENGKDCSRQVTFAAHLGCGFHGFYEGILWHNVGAMQQFARVQSNFSHSHLQGTGCSGAVGRTN